MLINRCGKPLLCSAWYMAIFMALPVWVLLYLLNRPAIDITWAIAAPLTFLLLVFIYPLLEEMVFRGFMQGELIKRVVFRQTYMGISLANLVTSLLFTSMHFATHPAIMAALVLPPSLIFGYFRDRYDGWLLPSMLLHIYYNFGYFMIFNPA